MSSPRVLILDEPTSVMTAQAADRLFDTLRQLSASGVSIVFISHKLHEVRELATRCAVMRAGQIVAEVDPRTESEASLARWMLGVERASTASRESPPTDIALELRRLSVAGDQRDRLDDVSFVVRSGEIVGIAGISGNGQRTLVAALSGELVVERDALRLFGAPSGHLNTAQRRAIGLRYVPEQRLNHAVVAGMTLSDNALLTDASLASGRALNTSHARSRAAQIVQRFGVRALTPTQKIETLSGGNLQKFIVGRELFSAPRVLLLDQPTSGVDAGSAAAIRNELIALRGKGSAILVVSEDLDELYKIADRLLVIAAGRLSPSRAPREISKAELGRWMAGVWCADANAELSV